MEKRDDRIGSDLRRTRAAVRDLVDDAAAPWVVQVNNTCPDRPPPTPGSTTSPPTDTFRTIRSSFASGSANSTRYRRGRSSAGQGMSDRGALGYVRRPSHDHAPSTPRLETSTTDPDGVIATMDLKTRQTPRDRWRAMCPPMVIGVLLVLGGCAGSGGRFATRSSRVGGNADDIRIDRPWFVGRRVGSTGTSFIPVGRSLRRFRSVSRVGRWSIQDHPLGGTGFLGVPVAAAIPFMNLCATEAPVTGGCGARSRVPSQ